MHIQSGHWKQHTPGLFCKVTLKPVKVQLFLCAMGIIALGVSLKTE